MAFQPIDIQVNVMQASNVADLAAQEREEPKRAKKDRTQKWVQERQDEENTSDEAGEQNENDAVNEDEAGAVPEGEEFQFEESEQTEENNDNGDSKPSEPDKGTYLDLTQ